MTGVHEVGAASCDVEPEWQDLLAEINDHELNDHFLAGVFSRSL